jgi:hypothetical protein
MGFRGDLLGGVGDVPTDNEVDHCFVGLVLGVDGCISVLTVEAADAGSSLFKG